MQERSSIRSALVALVALALAALACNVQFGGTIRTPEGTPPASVVFIAPANNSIVAEGSTITIAASASDSGTGVARIEFFLDGVSLGAQTAPVAAGQTTFTARITWKASGIQGHFLTAEAFRADGSKIGEAGAAIQVVAVPNAQQATPGGAPVNTAAATGIVVAVTATVPFIATPMVTLPSGPAIVTATPTVITINAQNAPTIGPTLLVTFRFLNVRAGPGTNFSTIATLNNGDVVNVIGRNADRTWYVIQRGELRGWVINDPNVNQVTGDTSNLPLYTAADVGQPTPGTAATVPALAPTSTTGAVADLVIDQVALRPSTPRVNETFFVTVVVRNKGAAEARATLLRGVFQPYDERSDVPVPPLPPGVAATVELPVTLRAGGPNQIGTLTLDANSDVAEGPDGEANNVRTFTYNVAN